MEAMIECGLPEALFPYRNKPVADALGVTPGHVSEYRLGRSFPSSDKYERLASFLKIQPGDVVRMATLYRARRDSAAA